MSSLIICECDYCSNIQQFRAELVNCDLIYYFHSLKRCLITCHPNSVAELWPWKSSVRHLRTHTNGRQLCAFSQYLHRGYFQSEWCKLRLRICLINPPGCLWHLGWLTEMFLFTLFRQYCIIKIQVSVLKLFLLLMLLFSIFNQWSVKDWWLNRGQRCRICVGLFCNHTGCVPSDLWGFGSGLTASHAGHSWDYLIWPTSGQLYSTA